MSQAENNDKIKKYIPYGLGIVTILLVIVILTVGSQNLSKRQSVTVGTTASTTTHQCTKSDWIGDGFCDDETNNPECDYDGDDCCGEGASNSDLPSIPISKVFLYQKRRYVIFHVSV